MTQIAIVGTKGSGKTTLAVVWANYMETRKDGSSLKSKTWETTEFVMESYMRLQSGSILEPTPSKGEFPLEWTLKVNKRGFPVQLIDYPGHDIKPLFLKDTYKTTSDKHDRGVLDYIKNSDIVILTVNVNDFCGEKNKDERWKNSVVLQGVLEVLAEDSNHRHIAVVFTAWDEKQAYVEKHGGTIENYLEKELPRLHNAIISMQDSRSTIKILPVAAFVGIESDTHPIRLPEKDFRSIGIDKLSDWILKVVKKKANESDAIFFGAICAGVFALVGVGLGWFFGAGIGAGIGCLIGAFIGWLSGYGIIYDQTDNKHI